VHAGPYDSGRSSQLRARLERKPAARRLHPLLPRRGARPLIINANHKAGQLVIVGVALEVRRA
jgi:hypothetical protein